MPNIETQKEEKIQKPNKYMYIATTKTKIQIKGIWQQVPCI